MAQPELPRRLKLLNWGTSDSTKGPVTVSELTARILPVNQRKEGYETVAVDFLHNTLPNSDTYEKGKAVDIAGYGTPRVIDGDGLWLEDIQWTPAGEKFARNYKDLSPAPGLTQSGEVVFLHSVALTPNGSVYDLEFFSAQPTNTDPNMPDNTKPARTAEPLTIVALSALLGLPETATAEEVQAKLATPAPDLKPITEQLTALSAKVEALSKPPSASSDPSAAIEARITALAADVTAIKTASTQTAAAREAGERQAQIDRATREGKVIPLSADTLKTISVTALTEMVNGLPATVPLHARGHQHGDTTTGNIHAFSAAVATRVKTGKTKTQAIVEVIRDQPQLYADYREAGAPAL